MVTGLQILPAVTNELQFNGTVPQVGAERGFTLWSCFLESRGGYLGRKVRNNSILIELVTYSTDIRTSNQFCHRISNNITLFIRGAFAPAADGSLNYVVLSSLAALWSVGINPLFSSLSSEKIFVLVFILQSSIF